MTERDEVLKVCEALQRIAHGGLQEPADAFTLGQAVGYLLKLSRSRDERGRFAAERSPEDRARDKANMAAVHYEGLPLPADRKDWHPPPHPWPWPDEDALDADLLLADKLWPLPPPMWKRIMRHGWLVLLVIGLACAVVTILQLLGGHL